MATTKYYAFPPVKWNGHNSYYIFGSVGVVLPFKQQVTLKFKQNYFKQHYFIESILRKKFINDYNMKNNSLITPTNIWRVSYRTGGA